MYKGNDEEDEATGGALTEPTWASRALSNDLSTVVEGLAFDTDGERINFP